MKTILSREHRKILETTVAQARVHAEAGAEKTLKALAVAAREAPPTPPMPRKSCACACVPMAGHYASAMLPNVFRPDSPALALQLPLETEQALEAPLAKLPASVFQADDSLGWSYQFWQAPKKEEVQRQMKQAGTKVGADELPAVTQLFTEQYMVAFLLEKALGGWWQSRHPRMKLPVATPCRPHVPQGHKA